jgi:hypothetical protein
MWGPMGRRPSFTRRALAWTVALVLLTGSVAAANTVFAGVVVLAQTDTVPSTGVAPVKVSCPMSTCTGRLVLGPGCPRARRS